MPHQALPKGATGGASFFIGACNGHSHNNMNAQLQIPVSIPVVPVLPYIKNTCTSFDHCCSAYCPKVQQGLHQAGDDVCIKTGRAWSRDFNKDNPGMDSGEAMALITTRYDKQNAVAAKQPAERTAERTPATATRGSSLWK